MTGYGLIGSETPIDSLIAEYFGDVPDNVLYDLIEDEGTALLACLLMEMRGQRIENDTAEATYDAFEGLEAEYPDTDIGETATPIESEVEWGYPAGSVVIYNLDKPLYVAFKEGGTNRFVPVGPEDTPFSLAPPGGLDASQMWYRRQEPVEVGESNPVPPATAFDLVVFA